MADITRNGLFSRKRCTKVGVFTPTEAEVLAVAEVAHLPPRSLVIGVRTIVHTPSGTAASQITARVGNVAIANNVAVATAGVRNTTVPVYFPTGGMVTIVAGSTAPAAGDLEVEVVVEYIELDKLTGEHTVIAQN